MTDPIVIPRKDHPISRKDLDRDTLHVLYKLKDAGYEAYLVGGAVRDLLMGRRPKDFDIATNARPGDLRRLFRNSRVVGRRFRLVHVFFGAKNIEVATLRSAVEPPDSASDDLYIEDDNQWGDLESDSFRRDFTVNALFYDIRDFALIDYTGGVEDIARRRIRAIGDPGVRFREDPVRMLRAIKFASRLAFDLDPATRTALVAHAGEINKASRFRVTEEIFRILSQSNREAGFRNLHTTGLLRILWPEWLESMGEDGMEQVCSFLKAVDAASDEEIHYPLEIICAGLFLPLLDEVDITRDQYNRVCARLSDELRGLSLRLDLPKRLSNASVELLRGQLYLLFFHHLPKRVRRFVESPWFDPTWRLHQLAFGDMQELGPVREAWITARRRLGSPIGGTVGGPDRRDIFSFRGRTGGGRHSSARPRHFNAHGRAAEPDKDDLPWEEDPVLAGGGSDEG